MSEQQTSKEQFTGAQLYALYAQANEEFNVLVEDWAGMESYDREIWDRAANLAAANLSASHEPPADPVGFVARSKIDGTIFRDFAKPGECHPINDQCEWMPVYARAPSPPSDARQIAGEFAQEIEEADVETIMQGDLLTRLVIFLQTGHLEFCDVNDKNIEGIKKPCNCRSRASLTKSWPLDKQVEAVRKHTTGETSASRCQYCLAPAIAGGCGWPTCSHKSTAPSEEGSR